MPHSKLKDSKIINVAYNSNDPGVSLNAYKDLNKFKIYLADTGLFTTLQFKNKDFTENIVYEKLLSDKIETKLIYSGNAARMMTDVLKGVFVGHGTAASVGGISNMDSAGKTGTTNDNKDGWFCGYTPYYTTAVWVGYDQPRAIDGLWGSSYPARIWKQYMAKIHEGLERRTFEPYVSNGVKDMVEPEKTEGTTEGTTEVSTEVTTEASTEVTTEVTTEEVVTEEPTTEEVITEEPTTQDTEAPTTEQVTEQEPIPDPVPTPDPDEGNDGSDGGDSAPVDAPAE